MGYFATITIVYNCPNIIEIFVNCKAIKKASNTGCNK